MLKKIGVIFSCIILTLSLCVGCGKDSDKENKKENDNVITEDGSSVNQSVGVIGEKTIDGFKFENTSLVTKDAKTTFISYMTNTNGQAVYVSQVKVIMKNDKNEEITSIDLNLGKEIAANETTELSAIFGLNLSNVKTIEYEIVK